jgi:predicted protein tyrosine phosphatase
MAPRMCTVNLFELLVHKYRGVARSPALINPIV